jgi:hypothetical protein
MWCFVYVRVSVVHLKILSISQVILRRMIGLLLNTELERCENKHSWSNLWYYPGFCQEGMKKITKYLSKDRRPPGRDLTFSGMWCYLAFSVNLRFSWMPLNVYSVRWCRSLLESEKVIENYFLAISHSPFIVASLSLFLSFVYYLSSSPLFSAGC